MPRQKIQSQHKRKRSTSPDNCHSTSVVTTSTGRRVKKTLKAQDNDYEDDDQLQGQKELKRQGGTKTKLPVPKTLEKIRCEEASKYSKSNHIINCLEDLSPEVCLLSDTCDFHNLTRYRTKRRLSRSLRQR